MKVNIPKHIHMYKRENLTRNPEKKPYMVFRCIKPTCNHHIPLDRALGKIAECCRCNEPFIIDKETIKLAKPHCQNCFKRTEKPTIDLLADFVKDV